MEIREIRTLEEALELLDEWRAHARDLEVLILDLRLDLAIATGQLTLERAKAYRPKRRSPFDEPAEVV